MSEWEKDYESVMAYAESRGPVPRRREVLTIVQGLKDQLANCEKAFYKAAVRFDCGHLERPGSINICASCYAELRARLVDANILRQAVLSHFKCAEIGEGHYQEAIDHIYNIGTEETRGIIRVLESRRDAEKAAR